VAARRAGARAAVCSNFTWDWIYAGYARHLSEAPGLLDTLREAYAAAEEGWRMPMHGGFETVPAVVDLPFVARRSGARSREEVRQALGLPCGRPLALVSFGGYGVEGLPIDRVDCTPEWGVIVTGRGPAFARSAAECDRGTFALDESLIYGSHLGYQDVVRAADVVITKPGYGIISDCVAADTAILYTSRGRFAEYDVLVAEMPRYLRCRFIEEPALRAGVWREALDALLASAAPPERPRLDGADVAAGLIATRLARA
jgi:L-arabinokinase